VDHWTLEAVVAAHGVNIRKPSGSHVVFERSAVAEAVPVPARRPIKPVYVRRFVACIEAVRASPPPSVEPAEGYSGKWQLRAPKSRSPRPSTNRVTARVLRLTPSRLARLASQTMQRRA
jgi:hypothetical protein